MKWRITTAFVPKVFTLSGLIFIRGNIERIHNILQRNNYPAKIIDKAIRKYRMTRTSISIDTESKSEINKKYAGIHYVPVLSENIARTFRTCIPDPSIAPRPAKRLNTSFSNMKSKIGKFGQRNVVYKIPCKEHTTCTEDYYIGHTGRRICIRSGQHEVDYENRHRTNGKTALIRYALTMEEKIGREHSPDFENTTILDREPNETKREFIEACFIWMHGNRSNNFVRDKNSLHNNYTHIINTYKDIQTSRRTYI